MARFSVLLLGLCALGFAGCSDGDDGESGGGSGVDSNKPLSDLTAAEATQLCEANRDDLETLAGSACAFAGLAEPDEASCQETVDACNAGVASADAGSVSVDCTDTDALNYGSCSATVGELEACQDDIVGYFQMLDCSMAGQGPPALPQCAQDLLGKCPDVFSTMTGGGMTGGTAGGGATGGSADGGI